MMELTINTNMSALHCARFRCFVDGNRYYKLYDILAKHDKYALKQLKSFEASFHPKKNGIIILEISYMHSGYFSYGRIYSIVTNIDKDYRSYLFSQTMHELDAENFVPSTMYQIAVKMQCNCKWLKYLKDNKLQIFDSLKRNGIDNPKTFIISALNGYPLKYYSVPDYLYHAQREANILQEVFNCANPYIKVNPQKGRKHQTALSRFMEVIEIKALEIIITFLRKRNIIHKNDCAPIHDGILIHKNNLINDKMLQRISDVVFEGTGYRYRYRFKPLKLRNKSNKKSKHHILKLIK